MKTAFLHGDFHGEFFIKIPLGFSSKAEHRVCQLHKSLYGLKQVSRQWFSKFSNALQAVGFTLSKAYYSFFFIHFGSSHTYVLVYVDDIAITCNDLLAISSLKLFLDSQFHIKDLDLFQYFLGIKVLRLKKGILLAQWKSVLEIWQDICLLTDKPVSFSMEQNMKLIDNDDSLLVDLTPYCCLIRRLIYLTIIRPEIIYSVHILIQFMKKSQKPHWDATIRILRYLNDSSGQGILLSASNKLHLSAFYDLDWDNCPLTHHSTIGYCTLLGDN